MHKTYLCVNIKQVALQYFINCYFCFVELTVVVVKKDSDNEYHRGIWIIKKCVHSSSFVINTFLMEL